VWTRWRWRGWHQRYAEDVTLSETLRDAGYTNALVTDVYDQFKPGKKFQRGFQSWRYIRGQESDALESGPRKAINLSAYVPSRWPEFETYQLEQYLMNRREWKTEEDWPAAQVFREAARRLIAFVADHGTMQGEQGQIGKGEGSLRTQLTHVPLIICHPFQARAGRRVAGYVLHTDLMPTLLDLLGVAIPSRVTGQSLRALMESGERSRREWIVTGFSDHGAIRTSEWLYIGRWNPGDAWEDLYDLRRDPLELNNVMGDHLDLVKEFRVRLKEYVDSGWGITRGGFTTVLV
jgi:arylsulfatase A-like enzyme